jgi:hemerythrin superfamily protein
MNVLAMILADHQRVLGIIQDLESTRDHRFREDMSDLLRREATLHMNAEERVFYPALRDEIPNIINKPVEEHNLVRRNLKDLDSKTKGDDKWMAKLLVIRDLILQHVGQEEGSVFDVARKALGDAQLTDMARSFQEAKGIIAASPQAPVMASARGASVENPAATISSTTPGEVPLVLSAGTLKGDKVEEHPWRGSGKDRGAHDRYQIGMHILRRPILRGIFGHGR